MEQEKKEHIMKNVDAIMEMAGCKVDHRDDSDIVDMLDGKKTVDEVIEKVLGEYCDLL